jgi:hypothetical protein
MDESGGVIFVLHKSGLNLLHLERMQQCLRIFV